MHEFVGFGQPRPYRGGLRPGLSEGDSGRLAEQTAPISAQLGPGQLGGGATGDWRAVPVSNWDGAANLGRGWLWGGDIGGGQAGHTPE